MPIVDELPLVWADAGLSALGLILLAAVLIAWTRTGRWKDPLSDIRFSGAGPTALQLLAVLAAYFLLTAIGFRFASITPDDLRASGSNRWFLAQSIDLAAKLLTCVAIALLLRRRSAFAPDCPPRPAFGLQLRAGLAAMLIILPIAFIQLQMGRIIWSWLEPDAEQPVHMILDVLRSSAWGGWGLAHLVFGAVVVAPIAEELFFRGLMLQCLWRYTRHVWIAIALSGLAFGWVHERQPQDVLPLVSMGVILGYVRVRYRSLTPAIVAHALFNAKTMLVAILNPDLIGGDL